ncbi:MAG: alkaline phosphatase [Xanthomonadales bacterium]|nr:alkaline phosphatase [Xanthomonadales bacterium]
MQRKAINKRSLLSLACAAMLLNACSSNEVQNSAELGHTVPAQGRNVILFLGDGMGISTITAARIFAGQQQGLPGESYELSFEKFPHVALSKTYNTDQQVPDSAGTMSAIMTGTKTRAGVISIQPEPGRGACADSRQQEAMTLLELAEMTGMNTGVISTARLTHATPAATYAHAAERGWEDDSGLSGAARIEGCADIARQLIEFPYGDGPEIAMGGGRRAFIPVGQIDPEYDDKVGRRQDGRNLVNEWLETRDDSHYAWNQETFEAAFASDEGAILGLFEPSHMQFEHDRVATGSGEPSLEAMTRAAIQRLNDLDEPYFLMVEGGRIDHAHHGGNAYRALSETVAMADAVAAAVELTNDQETLIVVTADHSHVFTIAGYPQRGNPILGLAHGHRNDEPADEPMHAQDGHPYTTVGYMNGPGYREQRGPITQEEALDPDFRQPSHIPLESETHGGEDVAIFAQGPGSHEIHGVMEQNEIFFALMKSQPKLFKRWQKINKKHGWPVDPDVLD